ncbi:ATP synthase epsilon chain [Sporosarcina sp. NCCP-2716]|uniref:F0F1 ATP synthase subunit epsilon n=1 Tax=Sporosarcina sp. NCCP-2716 TaxID=2943679 RepID=UPI002040A211|nr:F0F1 ATP synthase subunit epsilon [Sporosarcina sp. NCCP-2716]GKV69161.1 ATP synthase epsilon chain [Sporosarcina sp. NCCP-2716]
MKIKVNIVTPDGPVMETEADMVIAVTETGELGVLPGHIAMVAPLDIGALRLKNGTDTDHVAVNGGFLEVRPDVVTVLAQSAELASHIDVARAELARKKAEVALQQQTNKVEAQMAELSLRRAINRIKVSGM